MKLNILIILFFVLCFLFPFYSISAIGIGAKPSSLDLELKVNQSKKAKILVYNLSQEAGIFQVSPDELGNWIKINPNNFRLEAGENKKVEITLLAKEEGKKVINLSVLGSPLDRRSFSALSGIKIPLRLNVERQGSVFLAFISNTVSQHWIWIAGILVIILIGLTLVKYFRRRKKVVQPPDNLPIES